MKSKTESELNTVSFLKFEVSQMRPGDFAANL